MKKSAKIQRHFKCGKLYRYHNSNIAYYTKGKTEHGYVIVAIYPGTLLTNIVEYGDENTADIVMSMWMGVDFDTANNKIQFK